MSKPWCLEGEYDPLPDFVERALAIHGEAIEFMVLYGSRAKGNWSRGSDYDVLIGLRGEDSRRLTDRMADFDRLVRAPIQPLVYSQSEALQMAGEFHLTFLEALDHGVVLFDRGLWGRLQQQFAQWLNRGRLRREGNSWRILDSGDHKLMALQSDGDRSCESMAER